MKKSRRPLRVILITLLAVILIAVVASLFLGLGSDALPFLPLVLLPGLLLGGPLLVMAWLARPAAIPVSAKPAECAESAAVVGNSRWPAAQLLALAYGVAVLLNLIFNTPSEPYLRIGVAFGALLGLAYALRLATRLFQSSTAPLARLPAALGLGAIIGGPVADIVATLIRTPNLSLEQNPIARGLLDMGLPVAVVYVYGGIAQGSLIAVTSVLWLAFLRHRPALVTAVKCAQPHNLSEFFRAALGGKTAWQKAHGSSGSSRLYHVFWAMSIVIVGANSAYRWYLGMAGFGIVQAFAFPLLTIGATAATASILGYYAWLTVEYAATQRAAPLSPTSDAGA